MVSIHLGEVGSNPNRNPTLTLNQFVNGSFLGNNSPGGIFLSEIHSGRIHK